MTVQAPRERRRGQRDNSNLGRRERRRREVERDARGPDDADETGSAFEPVKDRIEEMTAPVRKSLEKPVERVSGWMKWVKARKLYRVWIQYSHNDGNLRAAGMSFQSLFAIFAALWLALSVAGLWLNANPLIIEALVDIINRAVPGLIGNDGVVPLAALQSTSSIYGWAGVIAAVGLIWTAIAWLYYTRQAVRAMFSLPRDPTNYVLQKLRDLVLALAFGVLLISGAVLSVLSTEALSFVMSWFGVDPNSAWFTIALRVVGLFTVLLLNVVTLVSMFRVLSRVAIPFRYAVAGAGMGSIILGVLSMLSGLLLGRAANNPLLASFAVFIGLLIWFNLVCRVILLSAAWIATTMKDAGISPRKLSREQLELERIERERQARLVVATADVTRAQATVDAARGIRRVLARRKLAKATGRLAGLAVDGDEEDGPARL